MAAPKGNQFWKQRAKHGRDKIFADATAMWEAAVEYFEFTDSRKWEKQDWVGKDATPVTRKTDTPYTLTGLCLFLDVNTKYLNEFKKNLDVGSNEAHKDFSEVITRIEGIIYTQKFEGATVGAFNANIISRDLGLMEKKDITTQGDKISDTSIEIEIIE